jgi:3-oxoacyl-[acyl-carrier-protein] synthase II
MVPCAGFQRRFRPVSEDHAKERSSGIFVKIAITGIGVVSTFGHGREVFWDHVRQGISGTRAITEFDATSYPCRVAAAVPPVGIDAAHSVAGECSTRRHGHGNANGNGNGHADPKRYSRAALFGVLAAREAWNDAGLSAGEPNAGVIIGSGGGGIDVGERQYQEFFTNGGKHVTPYAIAVGICGMVSSEISISLGLHGISHVLSTGCTSSTDALGYAVMLLRNGDADVLLSGGTEGCVLPGMIFGFSRMRAVSTHYNDRPEFASRPFDRGRDGFVLGEGAWMLTLEREARARARGAHVYATIDGYASTCDAYHRVQMDPDGDQIVRCMTECITRSGHALEEIGYISYHGTSTQLNDAIESRCTRRVFGARADHVAGSSVKSMIGHPQGASGAAGVVTAALALSRGFLPPTINLTDQDPRCDLDFLPNAGRAARPAAALCNCLGFGSKNSALVLGAV